MQMKHKKGADNTEQEEEERTISVISNLFQGLSKGSRRDRVAAKFVESEFEKCDRLMELYNRYLTRVVAEQVLTHVPCLNLMLNWSYTFVYRVLEPTQSARNETTQYAQPA